MVGASHHHARIATQACQATKVAFVVIAEGFSPAVAGWRATLPPLG
jgi:hypothetical protein